MSRAAHRRPERTCVGCGRRRPQAELLRLSGSSPGLRVHLGRGSGRGAYLCPDPDCLAQTVKRNAWQRAFGSDAGPLGAPELREAIRAAVLQKVGRLLGLARRAKKVVVGSKAVKQALDAGWVRLVLLARDDGLPAMGKQFREVAERQGIPVVTISSQEEFEALLGSPRREVVGLLDKGFAEGIIRTLQYGSAMSNGKALAVGVTAASGGGGARE